MADDRAVARTSRLARSIGEEAGRGARASSCAEVSFASGRSKNAEGQEYVLPQPTDR